MIVFTFLRQPNLFSYFQVHESHFQLCERYYLSVQIRSIIQFVVQKDRNDHEQL